MEQTPLFNWETRYRLLRVVGTLALADLTEAELLRRLADKLVDASGADGGFLIRVKTPALADAPPDAGTGTGPEFTVAAARHFRRGDIAKPEFEVSRTVIRKAIKTRKPVLLENAALLPAGARTRSLIALRVASLIALPLRGRFQLRGQRLRREAVAQQQPHGQPRV